MLWTAQTPSKKTVHAPGHPSKSGWSIWNAGDKKSTGSGAFSGCPRVTEWELALHHLGRAMQTSTDEYRAAVGQKGRELGRTHPANTPLAGPL